MIFSVLKYFVLIVVRYLCINLFKKSIGVSRWDLCLKPRISTTNKHFRGSRSRLNVHCFSLWFYREFQKMPLIWKGMPFKCILFLCPSVYLEPCFFRNLQRIPAKSRLSQMAEKVWFCFWSYASLLSLWQVLYFWPKKGRIFGCRFAEFKTT